MGSAIPSPTGQTLSSTSRTEDYFGKVWEDSSFKLNEYSHKNLISKPRTKESISGTSHEHSENNSTTRCEGKYKLKGSSRHRTSINSSGGNPHSERASKHPSQKVMLSKALQKANTAVLLDNAQNFEGAKQAYSEACALLQQVMLRSSGDNDRRKLEAIRDTYTSRIDDLEKISPYNSDLSKALPARPELGQRNTDNSEIISSEQEEDELSATINNPSYQSDQPLSRSMSSSQLPPRRESLLHLAPDTSSFKLDTYSGGKYENIPIEKIDSHETYTESLYIVPPFSPQQSSPPHDHRNSVSFQQRKFSEEVARSDVNNLSTLLLDEYDEDEIVANVRRKVNLAKQRVRQSEHEAAMQLAYGLERTRLQNQESHNASVDDPESNESEEEERMLEEMTRDYVMDDFEFDLQCKSALPRESDSSGFSGRTWSSSMESNPTTIGTNVSNVSKACTKPQFPSLQHLNPKVGPPSPPLPPPQQALPSTPSPKNIGLPSTFFEPNSPTVLNRTLLGQSYKPFQLETDLNPANEYSELSANSNHSRIPSNGNLSQPKNGDSNNMRQNLNHDSPRHHMLPPLLPQQNTNSLSERSSTELLPIPKSLPPQAISNDNDSKYPRPGSPAPVHSSSLRKKYSSSSLRNIRNRSTVISHIEDGSDLSPLTPVSSRFNAKVETTQAHSVAHSFPAFLSTAHREKKTRSQKVNSYLLEDDVHFPEIPGPPSGNDNAAAISLEPCPTEYLLRPFWLMRALYHTITHPKGGYISSKLYIPCDVWRVKGVKLKNLEEKISSCDLLTAALNRLSKVDTFDASAVLDEMHVFETVWEQTQTLLSKKLGNEVGAQNFGISVGLKDGVLDGDIENSNNSHRSGSTSGKSTFSWRRLRSKNSGLGLSHGFSNKSSTEGIKESLKIKSLPMTSNTTTKNRFAKKDINEVKFTGPNSNYMNALARLFDAAQVIDQIARQVSDPGLRYSEKTRAGLELCVRHAAEFFSFYICRFVLSDIGILLDKFVKKGGEWVLL
ncbi:putative mit domain-containing protein [Golovinomyces cichoracearum]|uniref:Putative mit domain-containing protein n=1 Tax=Golovinomyces cichoracearum TaxID=62708 RepID=A0A420J5M4_9PEZI|nr:putative mit domain-containing protein [Golovinomyces cichoracearum]